MLQRVQTIFLMLAAVATLGLFIDPMSFASVEGDLTVLASQPQSMLDDGVFHISDHVLLFILAIIAALVCIVAIFQYRRRERQISFARFGLIGNLLIILLAGFFFYQDYQALTRGQYLFDIDYGVVLPIVAILCCLLAIRAIRKDDRLVKSMDRLR